MKKTRWTTSNHAIFNINYHFVGEIEVRIKELLLEKAKELGIEIAKIEVIPDHVHLFVKASPVFAAQFKGYSSKMLRSEFASLKSRLPTLWRRSYF